MAGNKNSGRRKTGKPPGTPLWMRLPPEYERKAKAAARRADIPLSTWLRHRIIEALTTGKNQ